MAVGSISSSLDKSKKSDVNQPTQPKRKVEVITQIPQPAKAASKPEQKPVKAAAADSTPKPKSKPESPKEQKVYVHGETVGVGYTGYCVWRCWWSESLSSNEFMNQKPNAKYLFVELSVINGDKKARMIPPFFLEDENGAEYQTSANGWAVEGSIGSLESLNPSVQKAGTIVFDVPENHIYKLKLSGGYWSGDIAYVKLEPATSKENAPIAKKTDGQISK